MGGSCGADIHRAITVCASDTRMLFSLCVMLQADGVQLECAVRDLMKWCARIAVDFDVSDESTSSLVFMEALDCFCACLAKPSQRLPLAEAIAARLNISKAKVQADWQVELVVLVIFFNGTSIDIPLNRCSNIDLYIVCMLLVQKQIWFVAIVPVHLLLHCHSPIRFQWYMYLVLYLVMSLALRGSSFCIWQMDKNEHKII